MHEWIPFTIEHPGSLLAFIIGFVLLLLFIIRGPASVPGTVPYFRDLLTERAARIEDVQNQVDRALADIRQLRDDYAARLQSIETEARAHIDAAVREADTAHAEIITDAQEAARAIRRRSEEEIARERTRQRILLRQQIVQITLDAAEQSIRAHADDNVQRALIRDFIARAGNGGSAVAGPPPESAPVATAKTPRSRKGA